MKLDPRDAKIVKWLQHARDAPSHVARLECIDAAGAAIGVVLRGGFPEDGLSDAERVLRDIANALKEAQHQGSQRLLALAPSLVERAFAALKVTPAGEGTAAGDLSDSTELTEGVQKPEEFSTEGALHDLTRRCEKLWGEYPALRLRVPFERTMQHVATLAVQLDQERINRLFQEGLLRQEENAAREGK